MEWADTVMWNDKHYHFDEGKSESVREQDIDLELGEIKFNVINSTENNNPKYQLKNNEATRLEKAQNCIP